MDTHASGRGSSTAAAEGTGRPATRVRDTVMRYGRLLFQHKQDNISGIYPMKKPEHWRIMIVSHVLMHVTLLDPLGDDFREQEIDNVMNSYRGYSVST